MSTSVHNRKDLNGILLQNCIAACGDPTAYAHVSDWQYAVTTMQNTAIRIANKAYMRFIGAGNKYPKPHQGEQEKARRRASQGVGWR